MIIDHPKRIEYFHHARRYLRERDPVAYEIASVEQIAHLADSLRYEAFRESVQPYARSKELLLTEFFALQTQPSGPLPLWLQDALAEWDVMIAAVARDFGFEPS